MTEANKDTGPWRCFHCSQEFTTVDAATDHFGPAIHSDPACAIDAHRLRELEAELARYREEDTDLHREIHAARSQGRQAAIRAEEQGYLHAVTDVQPVLRSAQSALHEVRDLIGESRGVAGLHLNGDEAPWGELEAGGRFERLASLPEALKVLDEILGPDDFLSPAAVEQQQMRFLARIVADEKAPAQARTAAHRLLTIYTPTLTGGLPLAEDLPADLEVKVQRERVWLVRAHQSFMLAYDDTSNLEWYAEQLRKVLAK